MKYQLSLLEEMLLLDYKLDVVHSNIIMKINIEGVANNSKKCNPRRKK